VASVFIREEVVVAVGFPAARARLANLVWSGVLEGPSAEAYDAAFLHELRVGPVPVVSRLVGAQFRDLVVRDDSCLLTLRWEALGPGGSLLPVLDADVTLTPESADTARIRLDGSYRPPLGKLGDQLDRAILHRAATATIRTFLTSVADRLAVAASPDLAAERPRGGWSPTPEMP
jgi:hypothetical protein